MSETPQKKLEAATERVAQAISRLVKTIEGEGRHLNAEQISKAFSFAALTADAGRQKALAALNASALSSFSLEAELPQIPTFAALRAESLRTATLGPTHRTAPSLVAPASPGDRPSVQELGGRFCRDVRDAAKAKRIPGNDRGLLVSGSASGEDVGFVDEDEPPETEEE